MENRDAKSKIFYNVILLEIQQGHLKWKISDLARISQVSRSLVYYHLGKTKKDILQRAIQMVGEEYYALNLKPHKQVIDSKDVLDCLFKTRKIVETHPSLTVFYQKWRFEKSDIQKQFLEIERRYQKKLLHFFPHLTPPAAETIHALFHGLMTAPFISLEEIKMGFLAIEKNFNLQRASRS